MTLNNLAAGEEPNPLVPHLSEIILVLIIFGILYYLIWKYRRPSFRGDLRSSGRTPSKGASPGPRPRRPRRPRRWRSTSTNSPTPAVRRRRSARTPAPRRSGSSRNCALKRRRSQTRIVARGEEQLQTQRGQVVRELRQEIGSLAVELSEKIVGERLADDAQVSATVDSFIADLERQDAAEQAR